MIDHKALYVCHSGSTVFFAGTEDECKEHQAAQEYRTDSWRIHNLEDYGFDCYEEGVAAEAAGADY